MDPPLKSPIKLVSTRAHDECRGWCFIDGLVFHKVFGLKDMLVSCVCFKTLSYLTNLLYFLHDRQYSTERCVLLIIEILLRLFTVPERKVFFLLR